MKYNGNRSKMSEGINRYWISAKNAQKKRARTRPLKVVAPKPKESK